MERHGVIDIKVHGLYALAFLDGGKNGESSVC